MNTAIFVQKTSCCHHHNISNLILETVWLHVLGDVSGFLGVQSSTSQYQKLSNDGILSDATLGDANNPQIIGTEIARLGLDIP